MRHLLLLVLQMNRLSAGLVAASFFTFLVSAWEQENNELGRKPSCTAFLPVFFIQLLQIYVCRFAYGCTCVRINVRSCVCIHIVCVWRQIETKTHRGHLSVLPDSASRPMFLKLRDLNYLPWSNRHGVFTVGLPPTYTQRRLAAIQGNVLFAVFMISLATSQLNLHRTDLREGE